MSWIATAEKALTTEQARSLTDGIRSRVADLLPLIKQAYEGRADQALGYATWHEYCIAELSGIRIPLTDRPAAVAELRQNGMSTRAIGSALGISKDTVARELATVSPETVAQPEKVTSLDGRERPATMPDKPKPEVGMPAGQEVADAIVAEIDEQVQAKVNVSAALDEFVPDPDGPRRQWQIAFLGALRPSFKLMAQFAVEHVANNADEECLDELARLADQIASYRDRVRAARPIPDNVRHLRSVP